MQLAQLNIAESLHPMMDAKMSTFTGRIDAINALADRSEGFVWRLKDGDVAIDGALSLRLPDNETALVNMSVWESLKSLYAFIYKTAHVKVMEANRENFVPLVKNNFVLWWIEKGHIPSLAEAKDKLDAIRTHGATKAAFNFDMSFDETGLPVIVKGRT